MFYIITYKELYKYINQNMNSKKRKKQIDNRLTNLTERVLRYSKHIPLYNLFIYKKINVKEKIYGNANHIEKKIKTVKCKYPFQNNVSPEVEYVKCKKLILHIEDSYKNVLLGYFDDYINMYNTVIRYFNKNGNGNGNFRQVRKTLKNEKKKYSAPSHVLDGAIKLACASLKSALTNKKNKNIKHFLLKQIKHSKL